MASKSDVGKERNGIEHKVGHYRAYGKDGTVLWEKTDFTIGEDQIPVGLSITMGACTIKVGKEEIFRWNPWNVLP